jgi:hypothetical protein
VNLLPIRLPSRSYQTQAYLQIVVPNAKVVAFGTISLYVYFHEPYRRKHEEANLLARAYRAKMAAFDSLAFRRASGWENGTLQKH